MVSNILYTDSISNVCMCALPREGVQQGLSGLRLFTLSPGYAPSPAKSLPPHMTRLPKPLLEMYRIHTS